MNFFRPNSNFFKILLGFFEPLSKKCNETTFLQHQQLKDKKNKNYNEIVVYFENKTIKIHERNKLDCCHGIPLEKLPPWEQKEGFIYLIDSNQRIGTPKIINNAVTCHSLECKHTRRTGEDSRMKKGGKCDSCKLLNEKLRKKKNWNEEFRKKEQLISDLRKERSNLKKTCKRLAEKTQILKSKDCRDDNYLVFLVYKCIKQELLKKDQFFYKIMKNSLENVLNRKSVNGFRYDEEIIHFCLNLRFFGGGRAYELVRGFIENENAPILSQFNVPLPSIRCLQSYLPPVQFGVSSKDLLRSFLTGMRDCNVSKEQVLSWDEMDVTQGLVLNKTKGVLQWKMNDQLKKYSRKKKSQS